MVTSQNSWPVLEAGSAKLHRWVIPARNGTVRLTLRNGSAGFLISHFAMWWSEELEDLSGRIVDDWGWAYRPIRGQVSGFSNHASGTAADLNATQHPLGTHTLTRVEKAKIKKKLGQYNDVLRSGAFYNGRVDEMHIEINSSVGAAERVARRLAKTPRGDRILKKNPGQGRVIYS